jgi:hypothetical protein
MLNVALNCKRTEKCVVTLRYRQSSLAPLGSLFIYTDKRAKYPNCAVSRILLLLLLAPG